MSGGFVDRPVVEAIRGAGVPVVIIGGHLPDLPAPSVAANNQRAAYLAARHLLRLGHRRLGLVNGPAETYTPFERRAGRLAAVAEYGIGPESAPIRAHDGYEGFGAPAPAAMTEGLLTLPSPPTALVYVSDGMAEVGLRVCQRRGLDVPRDVSLLSLQDGAGLRDPPPPPTAVTADRVLWGEVAIDHLLKLLAGEPMRGSRLLLPVELIVRGSTAPAPDSERPKRTKE